MMDVVLRSLLSQAPTRAIHPFLCQLIPYILYKLHMSQARITALSEIQNHSLNRTLKVIIKFIREENPLPPTPQHYSEHLPPTPAQTWPEKEALP